jgi:porin
MRNGYLASCCLGLLSLAPAANCMESLFGVDGIDGELVITGDVLGNVQGGKSRGSRLAGLLYSSLQLDTAKLNWWAGGNMKVSVLGLVSGNPSQMVGDYQYFDNIDSPSAFRIYDAWYEHHFLDDSVSAKLGIFDFNSEFDVLSTAAVFLNSSFGLQPDISQNGPSTYPLTTLGMRLKYQSEAGYYVQGAVTDGVPGDANTGHGTHINLNAGDGQFAVIETGLTRQPTDAEGKPDSAAPPDSKLAFGTWYHTRSYEDFAGTPQDENAGFYLIGEQAFNDKLRGFFQVGAALADRNQVANYFALGMNYHGLLPGREDDILGFAVAHARNGNAYVRNADALQGETAFEMTYLVKVTDYFTFQPDIQYIMDPGMNRDLDDALVLGARAQLIF